MVLTSVPRVVVIPDIDAGGAEKWSDGSQCWLKTLLPSMLSKPYILEYAHEIQIDEVFSWQEFVHLGETLLEQLLLRIPAAEVVSSLNNTLIGMERSLVL